MQQYAKEQTAYYLTSRTGMQVSVQKVKVILPFYLHLSGIEIKDHHKNLMLRSASVSLLISSIDLRQNTIRVKQLKFNSIFLSQRKYPDESQDNLSLFLLRLSEKKEKKKSEKEAFSLRINRISLKNGEYRSHLNEKSRRSNGIDFSHLHLTDLQADISNIAMKGNDMSFKIQELSFADVSGFKLRKMTALTEISTTSMRLRNLLLETNQTALAMDLSLHYLSYDDFRDFENKVFFRSNFGLTTLSTYDLGFFVSTFYRTNNQIHLKGEINGSLSNLKTKGLQFSFGSTSFDGEIAMKGLPDLENTFMSLDIHHMVADPLDISRFHMNDGKGITALTIPAEILDLGPVSVNGKFDGTFRDFYTKATFMGSFGSLRADLKMSQEGKTYYVDGSLGVDQVDGGKYLKYPDLGMVSMDAVVVGSGSAETWNFDIDGMFHSVVFKGYQYQQIGVNGNVNDRMFKGTIGIEDQNIALNFDGKLDFNQEIPSYNFVADIKKANLSRLNLINDTIRGLLSTRLSIDLKGNNPDNLAGLVHVDYAEFKTPTRNYQLENLDLSAYATPDNSRKLISVRSDYLDGDVYGNFNYAQVGRVITAYLEPYMPGLLGEIIPDTAGTGSMAGVNNINIDLTLKNTGNITYLFTGSRIETARMKISGGFQSAEKKIRLTASSGKVIVEGKEIDNWYFNLYNTPQGIVTETGAQKIALSDTLEVHEPYWEGIIHNGTVQSLLSWKFTPDHIDPDASINTRLEVKSMKDLSLVFGEGSVVVKDTVWRIREGSSISLQNNSLNINNFVFFSNSQRIQIDGLSAEKSDHTITCNFQQIDLSWLDFLTVPHLIDMDGVVNGSLSMRNLFDDVKILSDLTITDFSLNKDPLGSLKVISLWDDKVKGMKISSNFLYQGNSGVMKTAEISGYLYPFEKEKENFDLGIYLDNFRINILSSFLSDITTDVRGFATGKLHLGGTFMEPEVTGKLKVVARNLYVDYLNTWYSFSDTISLTPNAIVFNHINLSDNNRGNNRDPYSGVLTGSIGHKGFRKFTLNLNLKTENFTYLNTNGQQDPYYYGRALATGNVSITGPVDNILVTVQAKTERNTTLDIPLSSPSEVARGSFINFVDNRSEEEEDMVQIVKKRKESILRMNMNITVTPDAMVRLIFDPVIGDIIEGNGSGDLQMSIDSKGEFDLRGQYIISNGNYTFNLENLISKRFSIKDGGVIRWTGDPYDADLNLEAVYSTKAHLSPLNMEDSTLSAQTVDCVIQMTGKLFDPTVQFGIEFPEMSSFDNEKYQALVKPNLNYHFLSLLAISRFVNTQSPQFLESGSSANIAGSNTTEILSNQLSLWLSNISDEFDVDFAYHPGTGLTPEQVEAAFKTQILNDRLTIESKVGIGGKAYVGDADKTSNMVGDIEAEYRIDKDGKFRVKAYNRYNGQNVLYEGAPYTQGIGIFYRKEFDSVGELVRKPKSKEPEAGSQEPEDKSKK